MAKRSLSPWMIPRIREASRLPDSFLHEMSMAVSKPDVGGTRLRLDDKLEIR